MAMSDATDTPTIRVTSVEVVVVRVGSSGNILVLLDWEIFCTVGGDVVKSSIGCPVELMPISVEKSLSPVLTPNTHRMYHRENMLTLTCVKTTAFI